MGEGLVDGSHPRVSRGRGKRVWQSVSVRVSILNISARLVPFTCRCCCRVPGGQGTLPCAISAGMAPHPLPASVGTAMPRSPASTGDRLRSLRRAGTTLYFMSGLEAPYYFAINFIPHRTMSDTHRHLSSWHLSATVAQIKPDSLVPKSGLKTVCFSQQLRTAQSGPSALTLAL